MKKSSQNLNKEIERIKLTASERVDLRERVATYMEYHPVTKKAIKKKSLKGLAGESFVSFQFFSWKYQKFVVMGAMIFVIGLPSLAEHAVPGDILYPMKVQVNEEVRSKLAFSSYAKVEWEADRLERRLAEARVLEDEGKLTEEAKKEVAQAVKKHSDTAKVAIASIRENSVDDAALAEISFISVLEAQNDIFALQDNDEETGINAKTSTNTVSHTLLDALLTAQADISSDNQTVVTEAKLLALIERETTFAEELFRSISDRASVEEKKDIERRLADISRTVQASQEQMSAKSLKAESENATSTAVTNENIKPLRQVLIDTRKLISFMTDIRLRNKVTVNELVPIKLTADERKLEITNLTLEVRTEIAKLNTYVVTAENAKKFTSGLNEVKRLVDNTGEFMKSEDLDKAEAAIKQAKEISSDLELMITADAIASSTKPLAPNDTASSTATNTEELINDAGTSTDTTAE